MSRSELQNGQPFPSVSSYTKPIVNPDGSIDILFGLLTSPGPNQTGPGPCRVPDRGRGAAPRPSASGNHSTARRLAIGSWALRRRRNWLGDNNWLRLRPWPKSWIAGFPRPIYSSGNGAPAFAKPASHVGEAGASGPQLGQPVVDHCDGVSLRSANRIHGSTLGGSASQTHHRKLCRGDAICVSVQRGLAVR
jgi:hypothetical protein